MANADHISDAVESVSLHLTAVFELADLLAGLPSSQLVKPYAACLAFRLLSEAAQEKLEKVDSGVQALLSLKRDMDTLAREVSRA